MLFSKIITNKEIAQWVWPGEFIGKKFKLYSDASNLINRFNKLNNFGFINQKIPGIQKITIKLLIQLNLKFIHDTLGSKIENKLFII